MQSGTPDLEAFPRLEAAVDATLGRMEALRADLHVTRKQAAAGKDLLRKFTDGEEDPSRLMARVQRLEGENKVLLERLQQGKEGVERLLARIRFLEEKK